MVQNFIWIQVLHIWIQVLHIGPLEQPWSELHLDSSFT